MNQNKIVEIEDDNYVAKTNTFDDDDLPFWLGLTIYKIYGADCIWQHRTYEQCKYRDDILPIQN